MATRISIAIVAIALIALAYPVGGRPAGAQEAVSDCTAFKTFAEANDYYAQHPEAASAIDDDADGTACEVYFGRESRGGKTGSADVTTRQDVPTAQGGGADLDCEDFATQQEAQAVYDADPSDPNNLDPNGDGIACALLPSGVETLMAQTDQAAQGNQNADAKQKKNKKNQPATTGQVTVVSCDNYATQEEAQAAFDKDPTGLAALDPDQNGKACEELPRAAAPDQGGNQHANRRARNQTEGTPTPAPATTTEVVVNAPVTAPGPEDIDCIDFKFQEDAQAVLDSNPADPYNLDPNHDGFACSSLPSRNPVVVSVPRTGVGQGAGLNLAPGFAMLALLVGVGAAFTYRRVAAVNTSKR